MAVAAAASASLLTLASPAAAYPPGNSNASCNASVYTPGQSATCSAGGFQAGEQVDGSTHSARVFVGSTTASAGGRATITFTVPRSLHAGHHTFEMVGQTSGHVASAAFTISRGAATTPSSNGSGLPFTGANGVWQMTAAGIALVLVGATAVVVVRRRRSGLAA
jgi:LPXTG-motif cell wall-anchored protein